MLPSFSHECRWARRTSAGPIPPSAATVSATEYGSTCCPCLSATCPLTASGSGRERFRWPRRAHVAGVPGARSRRAEHHVGPVRAHLRPCAVGRWDRAGDDAGIETRSPRSVLATPTDGVSVRKRLTAIALSGALILTLSGSFASLGSVPSAAVSSYRNRDSASPAVLPGRRSEIEEGCQPPAGDRPLPTTCGPEGLFGQRPP